jgi:PKD repeat protein
VPSGDASDFSDTADFEWNLADEAQDTDFEIDAGATSFYMPSGNTVTFKAKALNGTPPFTFTWNFGDGSPKGSGEMIKHTFTMLGDIDVIVTGRDASGAESVMTLGIAVATLEAFNQRMNGDSEEPDTLGSPDPSPALTP